MVLNALLKCVYDTKGTTIIGAAKKILKFKRDPYVTVKN